MTSWKQKRLRFCETLPISCIMKTELHQVDHLYLRNDYDCEAMGLTHRTGICEIPKGNGSPATRYIAPPVPPADSQSLKYSTQHTQ